MELFELQADEKRHPGQNQELLHLIGQHQVRNFVAARVSLAQMAFCGFQRGGGVESRDVAQREIALQLVDRMRRAQGRERRWIAQQHKKPGRLLLANQPAVHAAEDFNLLRPDLDGDYARMIGAAEQQPVAVKLGGDFLVTRHSALRHPQLTSDSGGSDG